MMSATTLKYVEGVTDHSIPVHRKLEEYIFQSLTPEFWIVWAQQSEAGILFAALASKPQKQYLKAGFLFIFV